MTRINIIKVGGAVVEDGSMRASLLDSFVAMPGSRLLVHGGGRTATDIASRLGIETRMADGRRITDAGMLEVVTMVYGGLVNKRIVSELQMRGLNAIGLTGADLACIKSHKRPAMEIDYGFVGDVDSVNADAVGSLLAAGAVPVIAPLSFDPGCGLLNTNADTIATAVATAFAQTGSDVTLTFCFEKKGVLGDPADEDSVIPEITPESYERLKASGVISGGMLPKLDNAFVALRAGVSQVVITNAAGLGQCSGTVVTGRSRMARMLNSADIRKL